MARRIFAIEDCHSRDDLFYTIWYDIREAVSFGQDIHDEEIESWFDRYDHIKEMECQS